MLQIINFFCVFIVFECVFINFACRLWIYRSIDPLCEALRTKNVSRTESILLTATRALKWEKWTKIIAWIALLIELACATYRDWPIVLPKPNPHTWRGQMEQFLRDLALSHGLFAWHLHGFPYNDRNWLVANPKDKPHTAWGPMNVVCFLREGKFTPRNYTQFGRFLGLWDYQVVTIAHTTTDRKDSPSYDPALRKRLEAICLTRTT